MPLTPHHVREKKFTSLRLASARKKFGYDEDEVDAFLDQVEDELIRLVDELERLKRQLADAEQAAAQAGSGRGAGSEGAEPPQAPSGVPQQFEPQPWPPAPGAEGDWATRAAEPSAGPAVEPAVSYAVPGLAATSPEQPSDPAQPGPPASPVEAPPSEDAVRRTLVLAQRTADAAIAEARAEADALVANARGHAETTARTAAQEHAERQRARAAEHDELSRAVEQLRSFERDYRGRLKAYLHMHLTDLDSSAPVEPPGALSGAPQRNALTAGTPQGAPPPSAPDADQHADPRPDPPGTSGASGDPVGTDRRSESSYVAEDADPDQVSR